MGGLHLVAGSGQKTLNRINTLIEAVRRMPFAGIGKPEPLLGNPAGYWSRRVDETHRLVYAADEVDFDVIACGGCGRSTAVCHLLLF